MPLVYLAGNTRSHREKALFEAGSTNRLLSYWEYTTRINEDFMFWSKKSKEKTGNLFLDSGAYSAMTSGTEINIDEYVDFLHFHKDNLTVYATLDVIGDAEGTLHNFKYMLQSGLKPLPVFHGGEDMKYLDYYCDNFEYVAVGGIAGVVSNKKDIRKFMEFVFDRHPNNKFHAFGITIGSILLDYPFYSCDSTSWLLSGAMGDIFTPYGVICISEKLVKNSNHISHKPEEEQKVLLEYFEKHGFTLEKLQQDYNERLMINALYMRDFQNNYVVKERPIKKKRLF